jgi:hypothetical protein
VNKNVEKKCNCSGTQKLKYKVPENTCEVKTWSIRITKAKTIQTKANS